MPIPRGFICLLVLTYTIISRTTIQYVDQSLICPVLSSLPFEAKDFPIKTRNLGCTNGTHNEWSCHQGSIHLPQNRVTEGIPKRLICSDTSCEICAIFDDPAYNVVLNIAGQFSFSFLA